jgi:hypothetical protein
MSDAGVDEVGNQKIREKRTQTLIGVWKSLVDTGKFDERRLKLAVPLVNETVEYYLGDYISLKRRYRIEGTRIQLHKIAGMMAGAILRFRPIIPLVDVFDSEYELVANEFLAVIHGIAICGEYAAKDGQLDIVNEPWFDPWVKDFLYMLHYRHYTSEALIFTFETLTWLRFPNNMGTVSE